MDELKLTMCPLARAEKLQKKAAEVNFDWQDISGVVDKITEELNEVKGYIKYCSGGIFQWRRIRGRYFNR
jgi:uncharacterized protein YabN with tetrapyrrole methylase and pyrophosphatase domain